MTPAPALIPAIDELLMIEPPRLAAMCRAARWLPTMTPKRLTFITRVKSVRSSCRKRVIELGIPALLNSTWSPPRRSTVKSTRSWTWPESATSVRLNAAADPRLAATCSPPSASTSAMTTVAPSCTKSSAVALPLCQPHLGEPLDHRSESGGGDGWIECSSGEPPPLQAPDRCFDLLTVEPGAGGADSRDVLVVPSHLLDDAHDAGLVLVLLEEAVEGGEEALPGVGGRGRGKYDALHLLAHPLDE